MATLIFIIVLFAVSTVCLLAQDTPGSLPFFVMEPRDTTVQIGSTARLECQVSSLADNQAVAWMKEATFQTSGRSLLTADPDKPSRITVEGSKSDPNVHFNLFIHNVRPEDAGVYHCYVVEFWELNERRWSRSRPATLTVVDVLRPSVRCVQPTVRQLADATTQSQTAPIGCTVLNNKPGMTIKLQGFHGTVLFENKTDSTEPYNLRHRMDVAALRTGRVTCLIEFRDETSQSGEASRSCSMGPFIEIPPARNRTRITVHLVPGGDAHLTCPLNKGHRLHGALLAKPSWSLDPPLPVSRYSLSPDGIRIVLTRVTTQDEGLVVSCKVPSPGGGYRVVDMEVRVRSPEAGGSRPDVRGHQVHESGGSLDRVAPKPVIGQAAWSVLRGRVSSGRLKPAPPSMWPGPSPDTVYHAPSVGIPSKATLSPTVSVSKNTKQDADNGTSTHSPATNSSSGGTVTPVTDPAPLTLSPLIIVVLCEAGMSLVILVIAFAVLCQCCCRNQTKAKVRGDKDLTLAGASFGKQSTTPTLLTYKSTSGSPNPNLSHKKLPPTPPDPIYARPESLASGKTVLRESDLPPTGSWVFSSVNSENGEAETNARDSGNEIYVTMV
ncbi:uncharacterized protein LOC110981491 [Acanthaster planci]|uniref:Uncharacterized protein LOC110981491 n=1 Tax=Acanthaster planci TaxID=133434 RepID=A0A8B7YTW4_ACAPL|nr:uncharacterized protein LOC110981491 [Acanthaster planci]